jgi:hypothetical protein
MSMADHDFSSDENDNDPIYNPPDFRDSHGLHEQYSQKTRPWEIEHC